MSIYFSSHFFIVCNKIVFKILRIYIFFLGFLLTDWMIIWISKIFQGVNVIFYPIIIIIIVVVVVVVVVVVLVLVLVVLRA